MTDSQRYLFDLQGFLVVEDALTAEQVVKLNGVLDERMALDMPEEKTTHRLGRMLRWPEPFRTLFSNPVIAPYLIELLGDGFRLDHDYLDVIRRGKGPIGTTLHGGSYPFDPSQYYHFRDGKFHNGLTVVAYNLKDVNPGDGGFGCVPGSHKSNLPFPGEWRDLETLHPYVRAVTGRAGSAVIFTEALTHGTLPWNGAGERRTAFFKYCPRPLAWARQYYDAADLEGLTDDQQRIVRTAGMHPRD
ncbi:MAG: phytanoyl-CoA dioxygenase family protein [Armatimonadota bacterium]|nr:phytanoyl-CoA dioxygenase family protein [Armatimonadota bacterium]